MKVRTISVLAVLVASAISLSGNLSAQTFDLQAAGTESKVASGNYFKVDSEGTINTFAPPVLTTPVSRTNDSLYTIYGLTHSETAVKKNDGSIPSGFTLDQNFPNPFNPSTTIRYSIGTQAHISLVLYDMTGRVVRTLLNAEVGSGSHEVQWDGRSDYGVEASSGVYVYRLFAEGNNGVVHSDSKKMVLMK